MMYSIQRAGVVEMDLARQAITEVHGRPILNKQALEDFLRDPYCLLLLAVDGDRVVGSLNGYELRNPNRRESQFLLYEVDVRPESRRQGIGRGLVHAFAVQALAAGSTEVWVITSHMNEAAMNLYQSCGFVQKNYDDAMLELVIPPRRNWDFDRTLR